MEKAQPTIKGCAGYRECGVTVARGAWDSEERFNSYIFDQ